MITGPNGPFTNIPPTLETHVEFIASTIAHAESQHQNDVDKAIVEVTDDSEEKWTQLCNELSKDSIFRKSPSWIFGANIPGKRYTSLFYFGGLKEYRKKLQEIVDAGYEGFKSF